MDDVGGSTRIASTFRTFWHGPPLSPYQLLCLRSFVDRGHLVEVFTYDSALGTPEWATRRDAREIVPTDEVLHYRSGPGSGSPSLHSNLFRYQLLKMLGGWWIDLDVLLLRADVPNTDLFFSHAPQGDLIFVGALKAPRQHPILQEAAAESALRARDNPRWGETGPQLWTSLVKKYDLTSHIASSQVAYPIPGTDIVQIFDPRRCDEVREKCSRSVFIHFFNEQWRDAGIPREIGPPEGSFLDRMFVEHDFGVKFRSRMTYSDVERWIANRNRRIVLEQEQRLLGTKLSELEARCATLEASCRELQAGRNAVLNSTSWRVTAPLRAIRSSLSQIGMGRPRR